MLYENQQKVNLPSLEATLALRTPTDGTAAAGGWVRLVEPRLADPRSRCPPWLREDLREADGDSALEEPADE